MISRLILLTLTSRYLDAFVNISNVYFDNMVSQIYSNKKETSDFHGTVSINKVKMLQQKENIYQT